MRPPRPVRVLGVLLSLALGQALAFEERDFLGFLGLHAAALPRRPQPVPRVLQKIAREREAATAAGLTRAPCVVPELGAPGDTLRALPDRGILLPSDSCLMRLLSFNLSAAIPDWEQPTAAELGLDLGPSSYHELGPALELTVSVVPEPQRRAGPTRERSRVVATQSVPRPHGALRVRLQGALLHAARRPRVGLGLLLEARVLADGDPGRHWLPGAACSRLRRALRVTLLVATLDPRRCRRRRPARLRRALPAAPQAACPSLCHRHRLFISFRDLGWHKWVIAPKGFMANYCHGECPLSAATYLNSSNYAFMQALMQVADPAVPPAVCVPTKLSPISMLYLDNEDNVILRHYEDMVVDECGCG
ncbi:growth/differentiation factor 3 [Octodon degus]|uniref:Growth/differentiation factor 3 n=1 Tax=Octodon degus TaxID=10160 RepID=A0A6P3FHD7_OCTDE|nr:growth/differentiation factor 3 [Octodon degus]